MNKAVRRKGVTIAAAALSMALVAPFAQSVAYPEISAAARADQSDLKERGSGKLDFNPPVFYANSQIDLVGQKTGKRSLRTTGILAGEFFPEGTKFELQDPTWTFSQGGGNTGWYGVGRKNDGSLVTTPINKETKYSNSPSNHPYVVEETGQILFSLGPNVRRSPKTAGTSVKVPMKATFEDAQNRRKYVWTFDQEIVYSKNPQVANRQQPPKGMKDPVFVGAIPAESLRSQGKIKFDEGAPNIDTFAGWYGQPMGSIGKWYERKNVPKFNPNLADIAEDVEPQYKPVENGGTQSAQPSFVDQDDQSKTADKPNGTKFSLGNGAPEGATVNADTGVVSLAQPVDQETSVPVKVTYSDGSSDTTNVVFKPAAKKTAEQVQPKYGKPKPGGKTSEKPTFHAEGNSDEIKEKPTGTFFGKGEGAPEGVTVDSETGVVSLDNPVTAETTVPVKVEYEDGSTDHVDVVFTPAKNSAPSISGLGPKSVVEGQEIDPIKPVVENKGEGQITASGLPNGLSVNPETGEISGTPQISDWKDSFDQENPKNSKFEDSRDFEVEVTVPGEPAAKQSFTLTVQRDTDGDGQPDATDADDDGDGVADTDELEKGSNPKDKNSTPASAPSISGLGPKSVVEGQEIDPIKPVVENKGEGQITASGLPNGLSVNPETGEISGTPQISDWKDSFDQENPKNSKFEDSRDFEVEVTVPGEPAAKQSFTLTVQRDTDGDGQPDATDADDDGDGVADTDELEKGSNPKDKNSTPAPAPSITGDAAEGGNKLPEGTPTKVGQKVANPTEGMSGTVTIDDKPVAGAKVVVDPETGEITVTVPEGTLGDGVTEKAAKVQITDADGNNVGGPIDAKVTKEISKVVDPEWKNTNLPDDGSRVNVPNTGDEIPHDTDVDLLVGYGEHNKGEQDWTVRLEENGSITVIPGGDAAPEDSIEVHVELTYADGSKETKTFIVKVPLTFEGFFPENLGEPDYPNSGGSDRPNTPNTTHGEFGPITGEDSGDITAGDVFDQADRFDPEWNDTDTPEDGSAVTVNNTGDALPHGTTVELGWGHGTHNKGTQDWDVELEENGDITVTPGADAEHGDSVLVQAVITYADGSTETKEFIVQVPVSGEEYVPGNFGEYGPMLQSEETELTAEEAFGQAEMIEPNWADTSTPEDGSPVTVKNTGDALPHGTKVDLGWGHGTHNKGTQDWDVDLEENGDITVKPGADAKPGDSIVVEVSITYPDGTKETKSFVTQVPVTGEEFVPGNFGELPVLTGDDNDDLTAGDVFTEAPTVNDVHPGDNIITGTGKPGATITVTGPNGFSTTTKVNENGNWSIDLPGGATPEAQYIVSQKDGDKAESDQIIVTVGKGNEPLPNPGSSELPGSSLGSSNFDIPRHLQCAVFAGGVTAIPLILLSPLHNMYELVMNPHLAGLREQFNREIHAIDQQVRRSVGPEGRAALDVLDHINGRVHQFNQQLGQFAHENRHIGLAAAAIAVAGLSYQHCMNTQANQSSSATGSSVDLSSSSSEQQTESRGIVGWFQGLFNRK
ncbi:hypothetical protein HMPREF1290_00247 [Corynebacterium sp. KPL1989]|nr:hypothetical protein HMPREF1290_00247 [Corynebacterium sp. KPL1989]